MTSKSGLTLIEMLVVVTVLAIFGLVLTQIFVRTLTANYKAQILSSMKQNGQYALEVMDKDVRGADSVVCPTTTSRSSDTLVIVKNGVYTRYRFIPPTSTDNGYLARDNPPVNYPTDPADLTVLCSDTAVMASPLAITDNVNSYSSSKVGVSMSANPLGAGFTRRTQAGFKDLLEISFQVEAGLQTPPALSSQIDPVSFTTAVGLR